METRLLTRLTDRLRRHRRELLGLATRVAYSGLMFAITVLLARGLAPEAFGVFSYALAWILLAASIAQLGAPPFLVREIAVRLFRGEPSQARGAMRVVDLSVLGASLLGIGATWGLAWTGWAGSPDLAVLTVGLPAILLFAHMIANDATTRGFGQVLAGQISHLILRPGCQFALVAALLAAPAFGAMTSLAAMATFTLSCLAGFFASALIRRRNSRRLGAGPLDMRLAAWIPAIGRLTAVSVLGSLSTLVGTLAIGALSTGTETGLFAAAVQLAMLAALGLTVINTQQGPEMAAAHAADDRALMQRLAIRACRFSLLVALPLAAPMLLAGGAVAVLFYGAEYGAAGTALAILAFGQIVSAAVGSVGVILVSTHHERPVIFWQAASIVVQVALSIVLVPDHGGTGAAWAVMAGVVLRNLALLGTVYRLTGVISLPLGLSR